MAPPADRDRSDGAGPKPRWNFERCQHADSECKNRPANAEREQQEFEFYRLAVFVLSGGAGHCARALVRQNRQQTFHGGSIGQVPKIEERLAYDFAAEQGAHARSSEPDGVAGAAVERQDKRIGQHGANGARVDVRAFRGWTGPTLFLPVNVKLAACGVFHDNRFPAQHLCPRLGQNHLGYGRVVAGGAGFMPRGWSGGALSRQRPVKPNKRLRLAGVRRVPLRIAFRSRRFLGGNYG